MASDKQLKRECAFIVRSLYPILGRLIASKDFVKKGRTLFALFYENNQIYFFSYEKQLVILQNFFENVLECCEYYNLQKNVFKRSECYTKSEVIKRLQNNLKRSLFLQKFS